MSATPTIYSTAQAELREHGKVSESTRKLAQAAKKAADKSWNAVSESYLRGDDTQAEYERGRSHAFCEMLGDQDGLAFLGVFE